MSARTLTELQNDGDATAKLKWRPMGLLLGPSPHGGWCQVEPGNWQHYKKPPSEEDQNEERAWLEEKRKEARRKAS